VANQPKNAWAVILGCSSGFGEATALALARAGYDIFGVHLDRRATMPHVEEIVAQIRALGREADFFNINAADAERRKEAVGRMKERCAATDREVRVLFHSLAFGTLKPFVAETEDREINQKQMEMTCDVMGHSLLYWTQDLVRAGLLRRNGRVFAMTSSGGHLVWGGYGAVSAAKAVLESHIRQLAYELAPLGITANAILAGVTDTPALRKIPGNDEMIQVALRKQPYKRLTTPEDVAACLVALAEPGTYWMTGNVVRVDGGEDIAG
jgi:NAD(P)-dependent dehydrogenase (short-subunit alcohol dehydrogenase family)